MRFETIGNATIIAYEGETPVLATDPWIDGSAYFGSWKLSHEIPSTQMESIKNSKYIWFSHGHPDHLNPQSLSLVSNKIILLPDHVGHRIKDDLTAQGLHVRVLPERTWVSLSEHIKVMCVSDYNQDALLLIDANGRLLADFNDGNALGNERFLKKIIQGYQKKNARIFLLRLFSYGDADMINYFREDGMHILPAAADKRPVGPIAQGYAEMYGATDVIPFSCFHRYQRNDSVWVNDFTTPPSAFAESFHSKTVRLLPAFIRYDCTNDTYAELRPQETKAEIIDSSAFGDNWQDTLTKEDKAAIQSYFKRIEAMQGHVGEIVMRVGGEDTSIDISPEIRDKKIVFETPRGSLMTAIHYQVFDDLLIGNFTKTTLVGAWPASRLYPDFCPTVPKYADNGRAYTRGELKKYFAEYRSRAPFEFLVHRLQEGSIQTFRNFISPQSKAFEYGKRLYFFLKK